MGGTEYPYSREFRETLRALKQQKMKSFRQDAKKRNYTSVSYNLEINHTLGKIFSKRKIVFYHFLLKVYVHH